MVSQNPPRPPWFREPPGRPASAAPGGPQEGARDDQHPRPAAPSAAPPIILNRDEHVSSPYPPSASNPAHPSAPPPEGRFPIRPEPTQPAPAPVPRDDSQTLSEDRKASLEARMIALEHDYAQSAESWRESSLAVVRALEILESRIGPSSSQPLNGMGLGEISNELSAMRAEMAQLRMRIDGFLPPPPGQPLSGQPFSGQAPPPPPPPPRPGGYSAPSGYAARPYAQPARLQRNVGRVLLSLIITVAGIISAWFVATHLDTLRSASTREGFQRLIGGAPEVSLYRPPAGKFTRLPTGEDKKRNSLDHYEKALAFYRGARGEKDIIKAAAHFDAAASQGLAAAQFWLGYFYEKGLGVEPSAEQAAALYSQAGMRGHIKAMHNLGVLYLEGRGVEYDVASASEWLLRAAGYGFAESMNLLGYINEEGLLGTRTLKHAYAWYDLAARMGHQGARAHMPRIAVSLSRRDRREAEALVNGWRIRQADPAANGTAKSIIAAKEIAPAPHRDPAPVISFSRSPSRYSQAPHYVAPPHPAKKR